ncbi:MAG: phage holin family protein [Proteobacteria bacterium]|jgi:uncharacterized membrane protein YqjE|nr:phage holin family protein [Pseudomonadota bacterium]
MSGPARGGIVASARRLADTVLGIVQTRLSLLGTELQQEKQRVYDALVLGALGLLLLGVALVLAVGFVVLLFQEGYRLAAVGVLALVFVALGVWLLHAARSRLHSEGDGPFALSLAELRGDRRGLRGQAPPDDAR